jgi:hypothetical protein
MNDRRWPKGRRRRWSEQTERRIASLYRELKHSSDSPYWCRTAIAREYLRHYSAEPPPPLRIFGQTLKDLGPSEPHGRGVQFYSLLDSVTVFPCFEVTGVWMMCHCRTSWSPRATICPYCLTRLTRIKRCAKRLENETIFNEVHILFQEPLYSQVYGRKPIR